MIDPNQVRARFDAVVAAMKKAGIWDVEKPADEALVDMGAFGARTMAFEQWLRWVFVPSIEDRLAANGPWPEDSQVAARATREGDGNPPVAELAPALREFDALFAPPTPRGGGKKSRHKRGPKTHRGSPDESERALADQVDALIAAGRDDEALAMMEQATSDEHLAAAGHNLLAWFFAKKRPDLPRAVQHGERAVALRPGWGFAHLNLAWARDLAGGWSDAYRGYLDALACGNAHDEAFAERRARELAAEAIARGEALPALVAGSPAEERTRGVEQVTRAIVTELAATPDLAGHAWFAAIGIPVPEGDVPFGWIGVVAQGRIYVHALVDDLGSFVVVAVLAHGSDHLVFRSHQVHGGKTARAARAVAEWARSGALADPQSLTPLDAAVLARTALLQALLGHRFRIRGGADYYAPDRPAAVSVIPQRYASQLGVSFETRATGGVVLRAMPEQMGGQPPLFEVPSYAALVELLPRLVESSARALTAFDTFRAREFSVAAAVPIVVEFLRQAHVAKGTWDTTIVDDDYPSRWPFAHVQLRRPTGQRYVGRFEDSAEGCRVEIGVGSWLVGSAVQLRALLPEIAAQAREDLARFTTQELVVGARYLVLADFMGLTTGDSVVLAEDNYNWHDSEHTVVFERVGQPATRVTLNDFVDAHAAILGALDRYLSPAPS